MSSSYLLFLAFLLGGVCGLRSMTAPALVCWGAYLGWLHLTASPLHFLASIISVVLFTLFALAELVADKLPFVPSRTKPGPLAARIIFGALCGWALGIAAHQAATVSAASLGALIGAVGALAGTFAGYHLRRFLTAQKKLPDLPIALVEDVCAIGLGLFVVTRF